MKQEHKDLIQELSTLLRENKLHEIEYQENGVLLKVVAEPSTTALSQPTPQQVSDKKDSHPAEKKYLTSPMVGVAYLSPNPDAKPYIKVGDEVAVGQTICLIEAMKTFNPITAQQAGKVKEVLINSGVPVEFNQPLFELE